MSDSEREYYAPREHPGVFRTIVVLFLVILLGGGAYSLYQFGLLYQRGNQSFTLPSSITSAQERYRAATGSYASTISQLSAKHIQLANVTGVTPTLLGACSTGWVAQVTTSLTSQTLYVSSTGSKTTELGKLQFPSCLNAGDLSTKPASGGDMTVTVSGVTVTHKQYSTASAQRANQAIYNVANNTDGSQPAFAVAWSGSYESATVSWHGANNCPSDEPAGYEVRILQQQPGTGKLTSTESALRSFETTKTSLVVDNIANGMTYAIGVAGRCGDGTYGQVATQSYTQVLPAPGSLTVQWQSPTLYVRYGQASSSSHVLYQVEYMRSYSDTWQTLATGLDSPAVTPQGYYTNYGDQFRVRAYQAGTTNYSPWSPTATLTYGINGYSGYDSYGGY